MSGFSRVALVLTVVLAAAPTADPGTASDTQTIVVEVPASSRQSPAPTPVPSSLDGGSSAAPETRGNLPATGQDAGMLVVGIILGVGALAAGALIARSRRRAG
ncbi:hypothetical protein NS220_01870 [Microbacterium testaceum]|uniref:Gram-positive cocci surface proteins LPxTG domain-containing protein n=1 Tax=Microbacterium testaceum TaxID=2033 RepID=A0A147F0W0_MICTE|nr:LPXTG cell wall anchor domain-containing protein [Microbacterium testaceum]KTR96544.1 hypothetical protein NS220_01870 [Microbacterium testaceum]